MISALVPMKGQSERVPSKNTRLLGNVPLFYHMLRSLQEARQVHQILVDTDSDKIKELLHQDFPRVVIIDRPAALLGAKVPMTSIIAHDLKFIKTEHFLQTHATSPFLRSATIDAAITAYYNGLTKGFDSVFGVSRFQTRFYDHQGLPLNHDPDIMLPSQDMRPIYEDNSSLYINSVINFRKHNNRIGIKPFLFEIPKLEALDIDEPEDFLFCEAIKYFYDQRVHE
jgi:CMP-N-acetylneuraminic acid synthetase